ncbi:MAG: thiamine-phosphate kinase [Omnitrophica WOR_2 bacterium RBG_13_44_8b]|nr:MAG: thiamine-phosphate kinase [Omnitrophica WOR_2 bacterium RBG_13_44_8b]
MLISKLGEFGLIKRFQRLIKTDASVVKGSGDDCAVLKYDRKFFQLFTCDMLVEGVDFSHKENPCLIGRKSIAVSISDIAACGGTPRHCVISVGIPGETSVEFTDKLFKGMLDLAGIYKINLVGGDLSSAKNLVIDVSMLGIVEKKNLVLRSGAKAGDIIFVSGSLGGSIKGKHLKFTPRLKESAALVKNFKVNAMIDISDGLSQDLGHILNASNVGALIYEDLIPLAKPARNLDDALFMGEDFELLFTLSLKQAQKLLKQKLKFMPIGKIMDKKYGLRLMDKGGRVKALEPKGYRHF